MGYITQDELITRFTAREIETLTGGTEIDPAVVAAAIEDASGEIDAYLGRRFRVPLTRPPAVVKMACAQIARYRLCDERTHAETDARYRQIIELLNDIADGRISLGDGEAEAALGAVSVRHHAPPPAFDAATQDNFLGGLR